MILESPTGVLGGSRGEQVGLAVLLFRIWLVGLHLFAVSMREAKDFRASPLNPCLPRRLTCQLLTRRAGIQVSLVHYLHSSSKRIATNPLLLVCSNALR